LTTSPTYAAAGGSLTTSLRDVHIGMAIRNLDQLLANPELAELTRRTGTEIIESAISELNREQR